MRTPALYRLCDGLSEVLLYFMIVFYPWAFGTTERWAIWIMNGAGYGLGGLLLVKWIVRWRTGYVPDRWTDPVRSESGEKTSVEGVRIRSGRVLRRVLAGLTVVILAYCAVGAINARVQLHDQEGVTQLSYLPSIDWLPRSYDQESTWFAFWAYLGLALSFWAIVDLLRAKSPFERHRERAREDDDAVPPPFLPERVQRLLWVVCLNGAWLAVVSVLQRLSGTDRLLWVMERSGGFPPDFSFGPYAYRSNAAQFFNLLWPVCFGFWWCTRLQGMTREHASVRAGSGPHILLLPAGVLMAACPILSTSWGGSLITLIALPLVFALLLRARGSRRGRWCAGAMVLVAGVLAAALFLGRGALAEQLQRQEQSGHGAGLQERLDQYQTTLKILADHGSFGVGAYAYKAVYQYYLAPGQKLYTFAHSDWLQTLAEWGWVGYVPLVAALVTALAIPLVAGLGHWVTIGTVGISLLSLLVHAVFDFPFQIQSLLFLFLLFLAILTSLPHGVNVTAFGPDPGEA